MFLILYQIKLLFNTKTYRKTMESEKDANPTTVISTGNFVVDDNGTSHGKSQKELLKEHVVMKDISKQYPFTKGEKCFSTPVWC